MGTKIEWTEVTWNPVVGCTRVSSGCDHCYAAVMTKRLGSMPTMRETYGGLVNEGKGHFNGTVRCLDERLLAPLKWSKPRRVFVNSMSDLFHESVPADFIQQVWLTMCRCPQHTFQILTKRADRMAIVVKMIMENMRTSTAGLTKPLPNVWLGTSVEDQRAADVRIPALLGTPAAVRFLSCEPLLGPVDLTWLEEPDDDRDGVIDALRGQNLIYGLGHGIEMPRYRPGWEDAGPCDRMYVDERTDLGSIHWVIAGGESGSGARPMHPDWVRGIRDQCVEAGVAFFFKQWGEWFPRSQWEWNAELVLPDDCDAYTDSGHTRVLSSLEGPEPMHRVGKGKAGRLLDGREWNEMPGEAPGYRRQAAGGVRAPERSQVQLGNARS